MCQETPRMQDFAPFTLQLRGPKRSPDPWPKFFFASPRFAQGSPSTFESVESPVTVHDVVCVCYMIS